MNGNIGKACHNGPGFSINYSVSSVRRFNPRSSEPYPKPSGASDARDWCWWVFSAYHLSQGRVEGLENASF